MCDPRLDRQSLLEASPNAYVLGLVGRGDAFLTGLEGKDHQFLRVIQQVEAAPQRESHVAFHWFYGMNNTYTGTTATSSLVVRGWRLYGLCAISSSFLLVKDWTQLCSEGRIMPASYLDDADLAAYGFVPPKK